MTNGLGDKRALVCPRRYWSGSSAVLSKIAAAAFFGSPATLSTAAGARILYLKGLCWGFTKYRCWGGEGLAG
ncbi:hypothetical protein M0804_009238 [Polistes exclamans]|nr:hypothetical protein M0804_009238 [Polistes exclamans]